MTQALHAVTRIAAPAVAFKAEAIVGPRDLVQYLGTGSHAGRVSDLAYHNSLMVQTWSMLATGNTILARKALGALPATPSTGTWITYARCHDDIGWAIDDSDAHAAGVTGHGHRHFLSDWYAGEFPESFADGLVFQANPDTGDRRISGTAASLVGLREGLTPPEEDAALARLFLAHALAAGWGGVPVVWSGDELGQPNDPAWASEPGHEDDNRWAHRPRLDWARAAARHDLRTVPGRVFSGLAHLARVRAVAAAAARVGRHHGPAGHRRRRARRAPPARERRVRRPLQRLGPAPPVPPAPAARGRPHHAVRRPRRSPPRGRRRRRPLAPGVRRVVGGGRASGHHRR